MDEEVYQPEPPKTQWKMIVVIALALLGFVACFVGGLVVSQMLSIQKTINTSIANVASPTPQVSNNQNETLQATNETSLGMHYFADTIMAISTNKPTIAFIVTATRKQSNSGYVQSTQSSFYDGTKWVRKQLSQTYQSDGITSNDIIKNWQINYDSSRVLKQSVKGSFAIDSNNLTVDIPNITNEIGMRSIPGYTKFMSETTGSLTLNGTSQPVKIIYTRIYSLNAADIQFYDTPLGLRTDWVAFWDEQGNFYHVDKTDVKNPTAIYETHQVGVKEDIHGTVTKTFKVRVTDDGSTPPTNFTINLQDNLNETLHFSRVNQIDKAPNSSYVWVIGVIEGDVTTNDGNIIKGFGFAEYIQDNHK